MKRVSAVAMAFSALLLGGCGGERPDSPRAGPGPSSIQSPVDGVPLIRAAMAKTAATSFRFEYMGTIIGQGIFVNTFARGEVDAPNRRGRVAMGTVGQQPSLEIRQLGSDVYLRGVLGDDKRWLHVDGETFRRLTDRKEPIDVANEPDLLAGLVSAHPTAGGRFRGVLDLTKCLAATTSPSQRAHLANVVEATGSDATDVLFKATTDAQGRLTGYSYQAKKEIGGTIGRLSVGPHYDDFGLSVTVPRPPAQQIVKIDGLSQPFDKLRESIAAEML